ELRRDFGDLGIEIGGTERAGVAILTPEDDRVLAAAPPQQILREVEAGIWKVPRAGHRIVHQRTVRSARVADHAAEVPHRAPEPAALLDRESVERIVGRHALARCLRHADPRELRQPRSGHACRRGLPQGRRLVRTHPFIVVHALLSFRRTHPMRAFRRTLTGLLLVAASAVHAQDLRKPTIDDFVDLVQASGPRISPDGRQVLFSRSEIKERKDNKRVQSIWIADVDGSGARPFLSSDKDRSPQWSPDGRHVAFLSTRGQSSAGASGKGDDNGPQIWLIRTDGGEAWKLTSHKGGIRCVEWCLIYQSRC